MTYVLTDFKIKVTSGILFIYLKWINKINLTRDPATPFMGIQPKDALSYHRDICSAMFLAVIFIIARNMKQPQCPPIKQQMKKCNTFTQSTQSLKKKKEIL